TLGAGCCPFSVTAVSEAEMCKGKKHPQAEGIPFYLPKPLLVISKNFYYIEEAKVGLTKPPPIPNTFDKQWEYVSLSATASISTSGAAAPAADGKKPQHEYATDPQPAKPEACCSTQVLHSPAAIPIAPGDLSKVNTSKPFFTYQIVF